VSASRSYTLCAVGVQPLLLVAQNPYPEVYLGCFFTKATRIVYANWVALTIVEGGTLSTAYLEDSR